MAFFCFLLTVSVMMVSYNASRDSLTGVLNRRAGLQMLGKEFELAKAKDEGLVVCFVDVDRFKTINDSFGHEEGKLIKISHLKY